MPYADPYLLPMAALLSAIGVTTIYRLEPRGRVPAEPLDRHRRRVSSRSRCSRCGGTTASSRATSTSSGSAPSCCSRCRRCPGSARRSTAPVSGSRSGRCSSSPGEFAKILLIVFLAGYLRDKREVLAQGRLKDFGPLLLIWGAAMLVLVQTNDLGSALLYFGIFLAMVYVATGRALYAAEGWRSSSRAAPPSTRSCRACESRVSVVAGPVGRRRRGRLPVGAVALLDRQRRLRRHRLRPRHVHDHGGEPDHPLPQHGLHLLRDRPGARARWRVGAAARLHALHRARDARRAGGG